MTNLCPRRHPALVSLEAFPGPDVFQADHTCSYCGSLDPLVFMARLEAGDVELVPTDKSYKVYIRNVSGQQFKNSYRDCPPDSPRHGPHECTHWLVRDTDQTKFYFQHLDDAQKTRFFELFTQQKLKIGFPHFFYVLPFFIRYKDEESKP